MENTVREPGVIAAELTTNVGKPSFNETHWFTCTTRFKKIEAYKKIYTTYAVYFNKILFSFANILTSSKRNIFCKLKASLT